MENETLIQYFEWYLPADGTLWDKLSADAAHLRDLGITGVWTPPAYKGQAGRDDVGYGVYDLYDLGEFDQKGTVGTKYGTKAQYLAAIESLHQNGIKVYADVVLNHRMGADESEEVPAEKVNGGDRNRNESGPETITAWTKFTFPGRRGMYSDFVWDWSCFDGVDWDDRRKAHDIFRFDGKSWDGEVDGENGNYDYLMGADLDMGSQKVVDELDRWGRWYLDETGADGVRLDAVKHIGFSFFTHWLTKLRADTGKPVPAVGEYWKPDVGALLHYLDKSGQVMGLFDVPLHFNFSQISHANGAFDLRGLFSNTLVGQRPESAVTFVDNHDTQPGQALQSWVDPWCKALAYACILLRQDGTPCVFYGDLYGIPHDGVAPVAELPALLKARRDLAHGVQTDYLDDPNVIGWTREGDAAHPDAALAVVLTDCGDSRKSMCVGAKFAGRTFGDLLGKRGEKVTIGPDGCADFPVSGGSVSVWAPEV